jgi:hypothetical protein
MLPLAPRVSAPVRLWTMSGSRCCCVNEETKSLENLRFVRKAPPKSGDVTCSRSQITRAKESLAGPETITERQTSNPCLILALLWG